MANIIARISGLVSYTDGGNGQFAATLDDQGNVSYNGKPTAHGGSDNAESAKTLAEVHAHQPTWLDSAQSASLFNLLPGTTFPSFRDSDLPDGWTTAHDVTAMSVDFSGRVTLDVTDQVRGLPSWEDFHVVFSCWKQDNGSILGAFLDTKSSTIIGASGTSAWTKITNSNILVAALNSMLNPMGIAVTANG